MTTTLSEDVCNARVAQAVKMLADMGAKLENMRLSHFGDNRGAEIVADFPGVMVCINGGHKRLARNWTAKVMSVPILLPMTFYRQGENAPMQMLELALSEIVKFNRA